MNKFIILFLLTIQHLYSLGVTAGTEIENQAQLKYSLDDINFSVSSNKLIDIVDHKVNMQIVCQESEALIVSSEEKRRALTFLLTNKGNANDKYSFVTFNDEGSSFDVENKSVYLDDGDGLFSLAKDMKIEDLNLSADESKTLFFVADIPLKAKDISVNGIKVNSTVATGLAYGEVRKIDNYYAVMTAEEESLFDVCIYEASNLLIELEKSSTLSSDALYIGSTIHYRIAVIVQGTGSLSDVMFRDVIPEGTVYVNNSLKLDGKPAGEFSNNLLRVHIGDITQETESSSPVHFITFDVKVL